MRGIFLAWDWTIWSTQIEFSQLYPSPGLQWDIHCFSHVTPASLVSRENAQKHFLSHYLSVWRKMKDSWRLSLVSAVDHAQCCFSGCNVWLAACLWALLPRVVRGRLRGLTQTGWLARCRKGQRNASCLPHAAPRADMMLAGERRKREGQEQEAKRCFTL